MSSMEKLNKSSLNTSLVEEDLSFLSYKDTPQPVSRTAEFIFTGIFSIILWSICMKMIYKENILKSAFEVGAMTSVISLTQAVCGLILRICNFLTEIQLISTHYENDFTRVFKATFDFNGHAVAFIILCLLFIIMYFVMQRNPVITMWAYGPFVCLIALALSSILCHVVQLNESKYMTARLIRSMEGVDYGSGLAFSYFYGYLRIVLPGLRQKMEKYEATEGVTIPVKKMFVLIPQSGHIPPDLRDASDYWLEGTKNLEHEVRDRAGVKRRNYKNTMYKIHPEGDGSNRRPVYVAAEGATPMLTFYEILSHSHKQTATYRQNRMQIVTSFYERLYELIDSDPECRDMCELVFYKDYDKNKRKVNVGELLLKRICAEAPQC